MGNDNIIRTHINKLDKTLIDLHSKWKRINDSRKSQYILVESAKLGLFSIFGAIVGGILGGPAMAVIGALLCGAGRKAFSRAYFFQYNTRK